MFVHPNNGSKKSPVGKVSILIFVILALVLAACSPAASSSGVSQTTSTAQIPNTGSQTTSTTAPTVMAPMATGTMAPAMAATNTAEPAMTMPAMAATNTAEPAMTMPAMTATMAANSSIPATGMTSGASDLRALLNRLLGEHVLLAASATNAALNGTPGEFKAAAAALDGNSVDLSKAIGSVYGSDAEKSFLGLWRVHIGFFVDYTTAVAKKDTTAKTEAINNLKAYGTTFGEFLAKANPNLTVAGVASLLAPHVMTLTAVIDDQAAKNWTKEYTDLRAAYAHMQMVADPLAAAIAKQFPDKFSGSSASGSASLRVALTNLLDEHVYLAALATRAALAGHPDEFTAAGNALDANSVDLSKAIGSVYGPGAEANFLALWRSHINFFVDYTTAVAKKDQTKKMDAYNSLLGYGQTFGAFLAKANPNLTADAVAGLLTPHVKTLTAVIDAQGAMNWAQAYSGLRAAYAHMHMVADPLSQAITKQFPTKFSQ